MSSAWERRMSAETLLAPTWLRDALSERRREREAAQMRAAIHESGHAVCDAVHGTKVLSVSIAAAPVSSETRVEPRHVNLVDHLVSLAAGQAAVGAFGFAHPSLEAESDLRKMRSVATILARGRRSEPAYVDAIIECAHEAARELVGEQKNAIRSLAAVLVKRHRVAGSELVEHLGAALNTVPANRARETRFEAEWAAASRRLEVLHYRRAWK